MQPSLFMLPSSGTHSLGGRGRGRGRGATCARPHLLRVHSSGYQTCVTYASCLGAGKAREHRHRHLKAPNRESLTSLSHEWVETISMQNSTTSYKGYLKMCQQRNKRKPLHRVELNSSPGLPFHHLPRHQQFSPLAHPAAHPSPHLHSSLHHHLVRDSSISPRDSSAR